MIKRIIFDLDDTLIMWKKEYIFALENSLRKFDVSYNNDLLLKIDNIINNYNNYYKKYDREELLNKINNEF